MNDQNEDLFFHYKGNKVPVTFSPGVPRTHAVAALESTIFTRWYRRCEKQEDKDGNYIEIHGVEIQSVDMFGARGVGFIKIKSDCTLGNDSIEAKCHQRLPGICFLRGDAVSILVALHCSEDDSVYSLLVDQPRVPIGQVSTLEIPAGMLDDTSESVTGIAVQEIREECGIDIHASDLVDLTALACEDAVRSGSLPAPSIPPSPGGCDEFVRYMYLEISVTKTELDEMRDKLTGLREHGEFISLRVVPMDQLWQVSGDAKAMIALFLLQELRRVGKLPPSGKLAKPLRGPAKPAINDEPCLPLNTGASIPPLAFGLYKIPDNEEGETIILDAIASGYRHFDSAPIYGNELTLGRALKASAVDRSKFFITSKVWNDAVREGRSAVRATIEKSLSDVGCGYFDLFLVHWPFPGHFVAAYKELELLHKEGKLKAIGLSNFAPDDYKELMRSEICVQPSVNQIEVSPLMYRRDYVDFFQERDVLVFAHKALYRAAAFDHPAIKKLASMYSVSCAQIMIKWELQKSLVLATKTSHLKRMKENRSLGSFELTADDMAILDSLTSRDDIRKRNELEQTRKSSS